MGRTVLSRERRKAIKKENIGKQIIFCEGMTEKRYLDYFIQIIHKNKFTDIRVETESANGNAKKVLKFAEEFLGREENNRKYFNYKKSLIFDCDAPRDIQTVIGEMRAAEREYALLVSNSLFEVWLLMHFEIVNAKLSRKKIYEKLSGHLVNGYSKADAGIIREIIQQGNVEEAIKSASELAEMYKNAGKTMDRDIEQMNPSTNVHELIEQFMAEIS